MATPKQKELSAWLESTLGQHEVPLGSNTGPFVRKCQGASWLKGTGFPWCACYVDEGHAAIGLPLPFPSAGAIDLFNHANAAGWGISNPVPFCVAAWNIGSGHTSFVIEVDLPGQRVKTIGGNESDSVKEQWRPISLAHGFWIHPALRGTPKPVVPIKVKKPKSEVVTSASGTAVRVYSSRVQALLHKRTGRWSWMSWSLGEGAWKGYGKRNPALRPNVPRKAPKSWWPWKSSFLARRKK